MARIRRFNGRQSHRCARIPRRRARSKCTVDDGVWLTEVAGQTQQHPGEPEELL